MTTNGSRAIRVAVIGAGSWGTTVASIVAPNTPTTLWARRTDLVDAMRATRRNPSYLADFELPAELAYTDSLSESLNGADVVVMDRDLALQDVYVEGERIAIAHA